MVLAVLLQRGLRTEVVETSKEAKKRGKRHYSRPAHHATRTLMTKDPWYHDRSPQQLPMLYRHSFRIWFAVEVLVIWAKVGKNKMWMTTNVLLLWEVSEQIPGRRGAPPSRGGYNFSTTTRNRRKLWLMASSTNTRAHINEGNPFSLQGTGIQKSQQKISTTNGNVSGTISSSNFKSQTI